MTVMPNLQTVQFRLAQYYLDKLRTAAAAVRQGRTGVIYGLNLFDQESQHIQHWHDLAVKRAADGEEWAHLCKEFPLAGYGVLAIRIHAADYLIWLESALDAAQWLQDSNSERAILHELSVTCYRLGTLDMLERYAHQLLKLGQNAGDPLAIGRGFDALGRFALERGMYVEAEQNYQRALQIFLQLGIDSEIGSALNGLGSIAFYLGDYQKAYDYFSRHLEMTEKAGKKSEFCSALLSVGDVLMKLNDYAGAEECFVQAVSLCRAFGFQRLLGVGLLNLGAWALAQEQFDLACGYLRDGIQATRAVGTQRQIIHGLSMLGYTRMRQGDFDEALAHLHQGLQTARAKGMPRQICYLQLNLAHTYLALGNIDAARCALHESLTIALELGIAPEMVKTLTCAVAYGFHLGLSEQASLWAGCLMNAPDLDDRMFERICRDLEAALGKARFDQALEQGKMRTLEDVIEEIVPLLNGSARGWESRKAV